MEERRKLDRRRLEEGFLLYACLEVLKKYNLNLDEIPYDRNILVEMVTDRFHTAFVEKWGGESINKLI